jgi:hypothetical protein
LLFSEVNWKGSLPLALKILRLRSMCFGHFQVAFGWWTESSPLMGSLLTELVHLTKFCMYIYICIHTCMDFTLTCDIETSTIWRNWTLI